MTTLRQRLQAAREGYTKGKEYHRQLKSKETAARKTIITYAKERGMFKNKIKRMSAEKLKQLKQDLLFGEVPDGFFNRLKNVEAFYIIAKELKRRKL